MSAHEYRLIDAFLIDAVNPLPRKGCLTITNDEISEISQVLGKTRETGNMIDLSGKFVLPGLWDVHTHIGKGIPDIEAAGEPIVERTIRAGQNCQKALDLGITSLRVVGEKEFIDVAWKKAFAERLFTGPNIFTCGWFITTTAGHFLKSGCTIEVDGVTEYVRAIREQIKNGVDFIKLNLTGGVMGPSWDKMPNTFPMDNELKAAFDLCHQRGFKVVAHAGGLDGIKKAIEYGAHTIEHGYQLDQESVTMLRDSEIYYVPTLSLTHMNRGENFAEDDFEASWMRSNPIREDYRLRAVEASRLHAEGFKMAVDAGVKIACGSDLDLPMGSLLETALMVRCGMTEHQAITAATLTSAEVCLAQDKYGTLERGKKADLIVLNTNPLDDIKNLRDLYMVIKDGQVIKQV